MRGQVFLSALLFFGLQIAQAQFLRPSGPPASALSPTADGQSHGVPASVLSLKPIPAGVHTGRVFFSTVPQHPFHRFEPLHGHQQPIPLFYPIYGPVYENASPSTADPNVAQAADPAQPAEEAAAASNEEALRAAYLQGARDAVRHDLDAARRDLEAAQAAKASEVKRTPKRTTVDEAKDPEETDNSPATVFVFKDGHQIETKNFAIMGKTLYDLSGSTLKKVQLNDLDSAATLKANDERGVQVKLP
jgi:hypothetical protein